MPALCGTVALVTSIFLLWHFYFLQRNEILLWCVVFSPDTRWWFHLVPSHVTLRYNTSPETKIEKKIFPFLWREAVRGLEWPLWVLDCAVISEMMDLKAWITWGSSGQILINVSTCVHLQSLPSLCLWPGQYLACPRIYLTLSPSKIFLNYK